MVQQEENEVRDGDYLQPLAEFIRDSLKVPQSTFYAAVKQGTLPPTDSLTIKIGRRAMTTPETRRAYLEAIGA